jgi:phage-related protein
VKPVKWHPKVLEFVRRQSAEIRKQLGEALRDVQKGMNLGMPVSRPMPSVGRGVHELRPGDATRAVRVFYIARFEDAIYVFHGFEKRTRATPRSEIVLGKKRFSEVLNG